MRSRIGKHWANSEVLYIELVVPLDHDYEARGSQWRARPCLRVNRNQVDLADQERPYPHRCCQCHALAALQTLDTWDKKRPARCKGHGVHGLTRDLLLGRAAGRKGFSPTVCTTHSGNVGCPPSPPFSPTSPLDRGTFSICISLKHTLIAS